MPELEKIVAYYKRCGSITQTATYFDLGFAVTRKILITEGAYESNLYLKIRPLLEQGIPPEQISEKLNVSLSTVNAHIPYSKGKYHAEIPSVNALRIRKHRKNKSK